MSDKIKHIKITKPTGQVSFVVFNQDVYNRLNDQNKNLASERKNKIEQTDITLEEVQGHSGFDENAVAEMNPIAANLLAANANQNSRIAELEAALEASYQETKEAKELAANGSGVDEKGKKK